MEERRGRFAFLGDQRFILAFFIVFAIAATIYKYMLANANNFLVFKYSFFHLIHGQDLYIPHPADHWDLFKYSPAFALLLGPIAILPNIMGALVWNLANLVPLLLALRRLPLADRDRVLVYWIVFFELQLSIANFQSNGLTLALMIFGFIFLEEEKPFLATLCIVFSGYIKIFGLAAALLIAFYPRKLRTAGYFLFWLAFFALLPLAVVSLPQLKHLYGSWFHLLRWDFGTSIGLSVSGFLKVYLGIQVSGPWLPLAGLLVLLMPLLRKDLHRSANFRYLLFCSVLIWSIIFNHKAESSTFIIALLGITLWFLFQERGSWSIAVMALSVLLISLSSTDLVPRHLRTTIVTPYLLKALPCILVWIVLQCQLLFSRNVFRRPVLVTGKAAPVVKI